MACAAQAMRLFALAKLASRSSKSKIADVSWE